MLICHVGVSLVYYLRVFLPSHRAQTSAGACNASAMLIARPPAACQLPCTGVSRIRPVESHSGARENIIAGPYPPILYVLRSRRRRRQGGGNAWREVSPHHPTRGLGECRKLPQRGPGGAPAENGFYAYFRSERSHLEHHFQYF